MSDKEGKEIPDGTAKQSSVRRMPRGQSVPDADYPESS